MTKETRVKSGSKSACKRGTILTENTFDIVCAAVLEQNVDKHDCGEEES